MRKFLVVILLCALVISAGKTANIKADKGGDAKNMTDASVYKNGLLPLPPNEKPVVGPVPLPENKRPVPDPLPESSPDKNDDSESYDRLLKYEKSGLSGE